MNTGALSRTSAFLFNLSLCWVFSLTLARSGFPQQKEQAGTKATTIPEPVKTGGRDSEFNGFTIDNLYHEAAGSGEPVFIISRLGTGERDQRLHERRLHNVIERFTYSGGRSSRERIVAAAGERNSGKGRIEIYVNGRLRFVSEIDREKDIMVDCCEAFPQYYPWYRGKRLIRF